MSKKYYINIEKQERECTKCGEIKDFSEFSKDKSTKGSVCYVCKKCTQKYNKKWFNKNREKQCKLGKIYREKNKEKKAKYSKKYCEENREELRKWQKRFREENREELNKKARGRYKKKENKEKKAKYSKEYKIKNREKINKKYNEKIKVNINFKLSCYLRSRLYSAIKGNYKSGSAVRDLGCSIKELKAHLEEQFVEGMNWNNHGSWHIDHIKPLASFDLTDREELLEAVNYTNLQPLWAADNLSKGSKIEFPDIVN